MAQYRVKMQMLLLPLCLAMCNVALSCCVQSVCSADSCNAQVSSNNSCQSACATCYQAKERLIYYQTMTPLWLEAHASYIASPRTATAEQLTFKAGSGDHAALLKVPLVSASVLKSSAPLTVEIAVAVDTVIGRDNDSDITWGISDGTRVIGFQTPDAGNYMNHAPCYGAAGISGTTLAALQVASLTPKPTDSFYPGQFVFTLKLDERWGSCYTAHDGGFVRTAGYSNRLKLDEGLSLEVYKEQDREMVGIKFIKVSIIEDA